MTIGVLALQGAFRAHIAKLEELGCGAIEVRRPEDLESVDGLVIPGGESTTMSMLLESSGLTDLISERIGAGMATFGTCAGLILLAAEIEDGRPDQRSFAKLDITVKRNGYGRQLESFETHLDCPTLDEDIHAVFIRAPRIVRVGDDVEVIAEARGDAVLVRSGNCLGAAFHPELSASVEIHRLFLDSVASE